MNKLQQLQAKIQELVTEIMELKFGCEVIAYSTGMWMHRASRYVYRVVEEQSLSKEEKEKNKEYCGFEPWSKLKLSCIGSHFGSGHVREEKYPESIEVYQSLFPHKKEHKPTQLSDVYHNELEILGRPITLEDVLMAVENSENSRRFMLETDGEIMYYSGGEPRFFFEARWKLGSPLQDQSEETIDFLHTLLTKG